MKEEFSLLEWVAWNTVEIVYNETGCNEQPGMSRFGAEVRSRRCTYMIIAISVITRTGYNEQSRLDLGARYIRFLLYNMKTFSSSCGTINGCCGISQPLRLTAKVKTKEADNITDWHDVIFYHKPQLRKFFSKYELSGENWLDIVCGAWKSRCCWWRKFRLKK